MSHNPDLIRCGWVPPTDELYCHYHDTEWGIPNYDSKSLFSKLIQDGMQAGLAWITILRKRDDILDAFDGLDPDIITHYTDKDRERLMNNAGIIRSKLKINAAISNARIYIKMRDEENRTVNRYKTTGPNSKMLPSRAPKVSLWPKTSRNAVSNLLAQSSSTPLCKRLV